MLYVIDNADIIGLVDAYVSLVWAVQFAGLGEFELVVRCTTENVDLLRKGRVLCRSEDRSGNTFNNCMIIRTTTFSYDSESGYLLRVRGTGLKGMLNQRIIWEQENHENAPVANVVTAVVTNNTPAGDRSLPNFVIPNPPASITATGTFQVFGENLGDWVSAVASEYGFGWDIVFDGSDNVFTLKSSTNRTRAGGSDSPVIFSREFDNLLSCEYKEDMENYANTALVGGEGEGTSKRVAGVGTDASGLNRFETYVDGSSVSSNGEIITAATYLKMLKQYGQTELEAHNVSKTFSANVDLERPYVLGEDYSLGDIVEVDAGFGITASARLSEIIFSEDENGKTTIGNFEEWEV